MKLGELLNHKDFRYRTAVLASPNDTIASVIDKLVANDRGSLPVCDEKGQLVGIITERDIVRKFLTGKNIVPSKVKVKDVMTIGVVYGRPEDDVSYAIKMMKERKIRHIPIVQNKKVLGMISVRDLLGVQLEESQSDVKNLHAYISGGYTSHTP